VLQLSTAFEDKEREWVQKDLGLDAAGFDKFFKATITKIGFVEKADLNETLYRKVFPNNETMVTETEFRKAIEADIQKQWDNQARSQLFDQIYHYLIDSAQLSFPDPFLKRWMQNGGEKPKTAEQVEKEYPSFSNSLKWTLILDGLVKSNNIEVHPDDLKAFAKNQLLGYMGGQIMDTDAPWMNDYVERMMKDRKFIEDSYHRIQTEKLFAVAETQVQISEKTIDAEAFQQLKHDQQH
jgi:trigger factor